MKQENTMTTHENLNDCAESLRDSIICAIVREYKDGNYIHDSLGVPG